MFPLTFGNKTGMSVFTFPIHIALEVLETVIRQKEEIKGIQIGKEKNT